MKLPVILILISFLGFGFANSRDWKPFNNVEIKSPRKNIFKSNENVASIYQKGIYRSFTRRTEKPPKHYFGKKKLLIKPPVKQKMTYKLHEKEKINYINLNEIKNWNKIK